ncbi:hypothetical protein [Streptomyces mexicanus]|uniref:hypothetical protein n=1 Tax=Streptomyces mexicanus TaxID=178566 RepID=UPI0031E70D3E
MTDQGRAGRSRSVPDAGTALTVGGESPAAPTGRKAIRAVRSCRAAAAYTTVHPWAPAAGAARVSCSELWAGPARV